MHLSYTYSMPYLMFHLIHIDLVKLIEDVAAGEVDRASVDGHVGQVEHAGVLKLRHQPDDGDHDDVDDNNDKTSPCFYTLWKGGVDQTDVSKFMHIGAYCILASKIGCMIV